MFKLILMSITLISFGSVASDCISNECILQYANEGYIKVDIQLNEQYKMLKNKLTANELDSLKNIQKQWVKVRDDICSTSKFSESEYGHEAPIERLGCLSAQTKARIIELNLLLGKDSIEDVNHLVNIFVSQLQAYKDSGYSDYTLNKRNEQTQKYIVDTCVLSRTINNESEKSCQSRVNILSKDDSY